MPELITNFIELFMESAPWLLLGLLIAGLMNWWVPMELLKKHVGGSNMGSIVKAAIIGAPLPLCSCGVIPAALGLRRGGASKPSTVSFLIATPETGVDSISVSYALLGPFMAIIRPISAIFTAVYTALLVLFFANKEEASEKDITEEASCCAKKQQQQAKSCCGSKATEKSESVITWQRRIVESLKFSSGKLLKDITKWLLLGLALAAVIKTYIATDFLTQWGDGLAAMIVMALVGIPMYICATASTPIAAGFLAVGISPGAVLVFMLAGPATNLSTMGMVRKEMGNGVLIGYILGIISASIGLGYLVNWLVEQFNFEVLQVAAAHHHMEQSLIFPISAALLAILMLKNWISGLLKVNSRVKTSQKL
ncbi:MAG: SO_0444 family Cu/Zn efflux transporter [Kangiellaceae bacterium]|nr:SO_0444 family Cu/Zn efflux transporter [Kangiellaceae bacterium]MCW9001025.1 SO_0444 family Cu/Zn efflux transporter [Kangiellaceae bacterium]